MRYGREYCATRDPVGFVTPSGTWFVTGASRGLGRAIVEAAVADGANVVATARNPADLEELKADRPEQLLTLPLDVTDGYSVGAALRATVDRFEHVDVVVNNAGFANVAPLETGSEDAFRRQFETNFWGTYRVCRAAVPLMRRQGGGTIVQMSSMGGRVGGSVGLAFYDASKFAIDGLTRALERETASFGIRYLVLEPGGFATEWAGAARDVQQIGPEYNETAGAFVRALGGPAYKAGDPARLAEILVQVVARADMPSHLVLGIRATKRAVDHSRKRTEQLLRWQDVSESADFAGVYPPPWPESAPS